MSQPRHRLELAALGLLPLLWACDLRSFWGGSFLSEEADRCARDPAACSPCDDGGCQPVTDSGMARCLGPEDCPASGACRVEDSTPGADVAAVGRCLPVDRVCVIDSATCKGERDGSPEHPFCEPSEAVGRCAYARLRPRRDGGRYGLVTVRSGSLAIFGPGRITGAVIGGAEASTANATLTLLDLSVEQPGKTALSCRDGAQVSLRQVTVQNSDIGVVASGCARLVIDRSRISGNQNDGLQLGLGTREYRVTNTLISSNAKDPEASAQGVYIESAGKGRFAYNTVVDNGKKDGENGGVFCSQPAQLADSILVGNSAGMRGTQLGGMCQLARVVVGLDNTLAAGAIKMPAELDPQTYQLTERSACCIDTAETDLTVVTDNLGTPRPQRRGYDIGFHELR